MYDWIYDHVINTLFFPILVVGMLIMILVGLIYRDFKETSNK